MQELLQEHLPREAPQLLAPRGPPGVVSAVVDLLGETSGQERPSQGKRVKPGGAS
jgi:hypothetical protein